jgi:hypothetical protein
VSLSRGDVENYVKYAERLSDDLEVCLSDLRFRAAGGNLHLAVDFSEIHSFLVVPSELPDDWLWPGIDGNMKIVVEHSALSQVLTGPPKPVLLAPYFLEFRNFLSNQASTLGDLQMRTMQDGALAYQELEELMQADDAQAMMTLAIRIDREQYRPTEEELRSAVTFFESRAESLVRIVRSEVMQPIQRATAFLETNPFRSLDSITPVQLTGKEPEVAERFKRLKKARGAQRDGATFIDALAVEYVRRADKQLRKRGTKARVLLVSRSSALARLVQEETLAGMWQESEHGVLRHPRSFAPLAWHAQLAPDTVIPQLEATLASVKLCSRSARLRLAGNWDQLEKRRSDRELTEQILGLKKHILDLTNMGGGINESRVLIKDNAANEHEVLRLLAMLRNHDEVLNAVAQRMSEINMQVDRAHELVGMLLQVEDAVGRELAVDRPAQGVRRVVPKMGRLPYALRFRDQHLVTLLDELRRNPTITQEDVRDFAVRATRETADHYETLLFMAYILGLVGQYELAASYCGRALQSAARHGREDRREALFFHALCTRVLARTREEYVDALRALNAIDEDHSDARYLAEQGNIRIRWHEHALEDPTWEPAPTLDEAIDWLDRGASSADDPRLVASIQNSLCYALTRAFERSPTPELGQRANSALLSLTTTLYGIEENPDNWPLRIKDTIARGTLSLLGSTYDPALLRQIIRGIRKDLESDTFVGDREELRRRLKEYEAQLSSGK